MEPEAQTTGTTIQKEPHITSEATNVSQNNVTLQQISQNLPQNSMKNFAGGKPESSNNSVVSDPAIISFIPTSSSSALSSVH
jgi:hypothetical protein